jgi:hypothetical protein
VFVAGLFTFHTPTATTLTGTFDMGSDLVLDLKGTITPANGDNPDRRYQGFGRANTGTDGWEYDYHGFDAFHWPARVARFNRWSDRSCVPSRMTTAPSA